MCQFLQGERVLEKLRVLQIAILEHAVFELGDDLDFFFVNEAISYTHDRLLHLFCQGNAPLEKRQIVLTEVKSIVSNPEVVIETSLDHIKLLSCGFFFSLGCTLMHHHMVTIWVLVLCICGAYSAISS